MERAKPSPSHEESDDMAVTSATCKVCQLPIAELQQLLQRSCPFCERSFRRADAVRRHARTCPARANRPLPTAKRGRKSRACDACSRDKTLCDGAMPCARCSTRSSECVYSSLCHDASHRGATDGAFRASAGRDERMKLSFLLGMSDPRRDPMLWMMETEPENQVREGGQDTALPGLSAWLEGTIDPALLLLDLPESQFGSIAASNIESERPHDESTAVATVQRMQTLETIFRNMLILRPKLQHGFDLSYRNGFFASSHIERAMSTDGRRSSQLATFIHWSTFDAEKVSLPLLLAVMVVKTAYLDYSRDSQVSILNTSFLELVEDYIFDNLRECVAASNPAELIREGHGFDTCCAAGVIISVQCTINNPTTRERIATERLPYVSAILRKSGLISSKHTTPLSEVGWREFAHTEARIRLAMALHNNCALLASFCNHPPAVAGREMTGSLPCHHELWDAGSQSAFETRQRLLPSHHLPLSFSEASAMLLDDDLTESMSSALQNLSFYQLFVLIVGFQSVVYNFRASMLCGSTSTGLTLLRALDRWASLWIPAMQCIPEQQLIGLGMAQLAPELAFLMKRILEVSGTPEANDLGYFDGTVRYDTADLHEFVEKHGLSAAPVAE